MTNLYKLAENISSHLKYLELDNGNTRVIWNDDAPQDLREWFNNVNGEYANHNLNELEEVYTVLDHLCDLIVENDEDSTQDELIDLISQKDWAHDGSYDLLMWVGESLTRIDDVDNAMSDDAQGIISAISQAMQRTRTDMAYAFLNAMTEKAGE